MKTFKALSALLTYPTAELVEALDELESALDVENLLAQRERDALRPLFTQLRTIDLLTLQERYVELFDRVRSLSLHLFEHVHGDSRDRGSAMVDLNRIYQEHGFALAANELPDYLPAVLEYLSCRPVDEARGMLADAAHILEAVEARLTRRASPYAGVFGALVHLSGETCHASQVSDEEIAREDDPATLDKEWQDAPVTFGPCGGDDLKQQSVIHFHRSAAP